MVGVTTLRNSKDQTVILRVGDHPFIRHDSTIFYGDAMIVDVRRLEAEIAAGLALVREQCPPATLKFVQDGVAASPFTRPKVLRFCRDRWRSKQTRGGHDGDHQRSDVAPAASCWLDRFRLNSSSMSL
jgi:hypothetical protein